MQNSVYGPFLDFFVGGVLPRGVPAATRAAFEAEPSLLANAPLSAADIDALHSRYPTIANAYAAPEWRTRYAARGLDAATFGAPELSR